MHQCALQLLLTNAYQTGETTDFALRLVSVSFIVFSVAWLASLAIRCKENINHLTVGRRLMQTRI